MSWTTTVTDSQLVAIHAALVPTEPDGVIVYFGDWTGGEGGVGVQEATHTRLHHLQPGHPTPIETLSGADVLPTTDVFCGGQAFLADGRLLAAGGTFGWAESARGLHAPHYDGERACWIYLPRAKQWVAAADLNFQPGSNSIGGGRWYPTLVTLENGEVFVVGGHPASDDSYPTNVGDDAKRHNNNTPERYSPGSNTWTLMTADITAPDGFGYATDGYPRFHLLPDGMLFSDTAGKDSGNGALSKKRVFDPFAGVWTGPDVGGLDTLTASYDRGSAATSVLLPLLPPLYRARILACNSGDPTAFRIDVDDSPTWVPTSARTGDAAGRYRENALRHAPADRSGAGHGRLAGRLGRRGSSTQRPSCPSCTPPASTGTPATSPTARPRSGRRSTSRRRIAAATTPPRCCCPTAASGTAVRRRRPNR